MWHVMPLPREPCQNDTPSPPPFIVYRSSCHLRLVISRRLLCLIPRPVGLWRVTHSVGVGVSPPPPRDLPNYWTDFQNSNVIRYMRELSEHGVKFDLEVTDDVTGQVKVKMFDFSGLVTSASTISDVKRKQSQ